MDPNAAVHILNDPDTDLTEFIDTIDDLDDWIQKGGTPPSIRLEPKTISAAFFFSREEVSLRIDRAISEASE